MRIRLYVLRINDRDQYDKKKNYDNHKSIRKFYDESHLEEFIKQKIENKRDQLLIISKFCVKTLFNLTCKLLVFVDKNIQNRIQIYVTTHIDAKIKLTHLKFQFKKYQDFWNLNRFNVSYRKVIWILKWTLNVIQIMIQIILIQ